MDRAPTGAEAEQRQVRARSGRVAAAWQETPDLDRAALAAALARDIEGEVRFDAGDRALYATDASNYRQVPIGVVIPRTFADVERTLAVCRDAGAPVLPRGGGTSLSGETCNTAVVLDFSKYLDRVLALDPEARVARVEAGCVLDTLRDAAEEHGLTFGPDPATHDHNSLGGMIGNNSGGVHALMNGITVHNVRRLEVLTYDGLRLEVGPTPDHELKSIVRAGGRRGEIYRRLDELRGRYGDLIRAKYPDIPRRVSGYEGLNWLLPEKGFDVARALVGSEGTCATVLAATVELIPSPRARVIALIGFPDIFAAADAVPQVLEHGPIGLEGMDQLLVEFMRKKRLHVDDIEVLPEGGGWLLVEFGADTAEEAVERAERLVAVLETGEGVHGKVVRDQLQQKRIWNVRESGLGATAYVPNHPDTWPGWEDSAVHRDNLGTYLRELKALFRKHGYDPSFYGHFGDGLVHCRAAFDLYSEPGIATWRRFLEEAADLVVRYDGSLSGEHGDGQARAALLDKMYGPELVDCFREFKAIWDPRGKMNPGKVIDPYPITSNLRVGPSYQPPQLSTWFSYPEDAGSFARAVQRCVGVGKCRRQSSEDGVMCPSFMATREEKHSTRGRARLLFEMLHGGPVESGWRSTEVREALSLCLACKGCKSDCPVQVDMATYKAEFNAYHYRWRLRPRAAYSMGRIADWARAGSVAPGLANFVSQAPVVSALAKPVGGIAQGRSIPAFADRSFTAWFRSRPPPAQRGPRVLLWPDTFNNYFRPQTTIAATRVLESLGFAVAIPDRHLCCGRPLYDWGWLGKAKRLWRRTLATLQADIEAGTPLVGLEPACVAAFKDELPNLFPEDPRAARLAKQTHYFPNFLEQRRDAFEPRGGRAKALVQIHCHQHALLQPDAARRLLGRLGVEHEVVAGGCCGMAGAFGFEAEKVEVSRAIAERVLLPRVRAAPAETAILADGFSCREQIEQGSGRATLHIADLAAERLVGGA